LTWSSGSLLSANRARNKLIELLWSNLRSPIYHFFFHFLKCYT
jgi:hypothetical protein